MSYFKEPKLWPAVFWSKSSGCWESILGRLWAMQCRWLGTNTRFTQEMLLTISLYIWYLLTRFPVKILYVQGATGSLGWLWDWNFGSGPEFSLCGLYTSHAYSEFFAFHNFFALHMGHRTPQLGTYTYCKIHALCKIFALHKIVVLRVFFLFFRFFVFSFFFAKIACNHVFWNMGKMEFSRETSVVSHTIAFQAILAKKRKKNSAGWFVIIFWYMREKNWGSRKKVEGSRRGPRILFYFRIPEN